MSFKIGTELHSFCPDDCRFFSDVSRIRWDKDENKWVGYMGCEHFLFCKYIREQVIKEQEAKQNDGETKADD